MLTSKENKVDTATISKYVYNVNPIGQRTSLAQTGAAFATAKSIEWGYDNLGQVTTANSSENTQDRAYQYDAIGNRQRAAAGTLDASDPTATVYASNTLNQYIAIQENSANNTVNPVNTVPSYDQDGNTLTEGNKTHTWDAENRLIKVQIGETEVNYQYDSQSRRIQKIVHQQGTDPNNESQITNNFFLYRFSTKPLDPTTNLYYYGYRDYEAPTGRWKSRDPIEEAGGLNIYTSANNNIINKIDILGLMACLCDCNENTPDLTSDVNKLINDSIQKTASFNGGKNLSAKHLRDQLYQDLIKGKLLHTGIEIKLASKAQPCLNLSASEELAAARMMKLCGKCVGTDKLGHFIEQGLMYYDVAYNYNQGEGTAKAFGQWLEGLNPENLTQAQYDFFNTGHRYDYYGGKGTKFPNFLTPDLYGLYGDRKFDTKGGASPADLAANESGLDFWKKILNADYSKGNPLGKVNICDYVNDKWDQGKNPNVPVQPRPNRPNK